MLASRRTPFAWLLTSLLLALVGPNPSWASVFVVEEWSASWQSGTTFSDSFDDGVLDPALLAFCGGLLPDDEFGGLLLLRRTTPLGICTALPGLGQQEVAWQLAEPGEMQAEATFRLTAGIPGEGYGLGIGDVTQPDFVSLGAFPFWVGATPRLRLRMLDENSTALAETVLPGDATALPFTTIRFALTLETDGASLRPKGRFALDDGALEELTPVPGAPPGHLLSSGPHATNLFALIVPEPAGRIDDFQDGTPSGWGGEPLHPAPPSVFADAGPAGVGDSALVASALGGSGPGSGFELRNASGWIGDYPGAGVSALALTVQALGPGDLDLRLVVLGPGGAFASATSLPVTAGTGWQTLVLPLEASDLVSVGGFDVAATLEAVSELRLVSSAAPAATGDPLETAVVLDDIAALSVCNDGRDNDGDGRIDWQLGATGDPGCTSPADGTERNTDGTLLCDDELDNDGDGRRDFDPATAADPTQGQGDPGCASPSSPREDPVCDDDLDNDGDGRVDWNGDPEGAGEGPTAPDPQCVGAPWQARENPKGACGLGFELAIALLGLRGLRRRWGPPGSGGQGG